MNWENKKYLQLGTTYRWFECGRYWTRSSITSRYTLNTFVYFIAINDIFNNHKFGKKFGMCELNHYPDTNHRCFLEIK